MWGRCELDVDVAYESSAHPRPSTPRTACFFLGRLMLLQVPRLRSGSFGWVIESFDGDMVEKNQTRCRYTQILSEVYLISICTFNPPFFQGYSCGEDILFTPTPKPERGRLRKKDFWSCTSQPLTTSLPLHSFATRFSMVQVEPNWEHMLTKR